MYTVCRAMLWESKAEDRGRRKTQRGEEDYRKKKTVEKIAMIYPGTQAHEFSVR